MPLVSAPSLNSRYTQLVIAALFLLCLAWFFVPSETITKHLPIPSITSPQPSDTPAIVLKPKANHPIDHLIQQADNELAALLDKVDREKQNVKAAATAYRERRGRQPPPGFDKWFEFAQSKSSLIVEDFFDQIYADLAPFWAVPAKQIREQANDFIHRVSVRNGTTTQRTDIPERKWMDLWQDMVSSIAEYLPDVDLAINVMDESRMVVPWEEINGYMEKERASRKLVPPARLKDTFQSLSALDQSPPDSFDPGFRGEGPYWPLAVVGCPPESPARRAYIETDFTRPPPLTTTYPEGSYEGYVQNWTLARSPCDNAALQGLHGTFVEPISISNTKQFFPLFGGSKLPMNNEILLPAAMYWSDDPFYSGGEKHGQGWEKKKNSLIWRGAGTGGRNKVDNWTRFQRHRFVSMVNATNVRMASTSDEAPLNFVLPSNTSYDLAARSPDQQPDALADWVATWSDAAVVDLICFPNPMPPHCSYTDPYFFVEKSKPMVKQYAYKYLPDLDGNSYSGRYRGFLRSTSLPIKATIYSEWHDSRLVPWKHFVPMDNTFIDIYGIMEYFVGDAKAGVEGHDEVAKDIALGGKEWAEKVLRKEDMQVYVLRLLLEYARLCDDERDMMGWKDTLT